MYNFGQDGLLAKNGHLVDAIFCAEPDAMTLESVQKRLDADESLDVADLDALLIAGLIKRWFGMLPRRLLQGVSSRNITACRHTQSVGELIEQQMGEPFESYFKWLLDVCLGVTKHEKVNKMAIKHLAMVMAPCLRSKQRERVNVVKFVQLSILWRHFLK